MLRLEDRENVGKVILSTEEYEDANSFHGEDVSTLRRDIQGDHHINSFSRAAVPP